MFTNRQTPAQVVFKLRCLRPQRNAFALNPRLFQTQGRTTNCRRSALAISENRLITNPSVSPDRQSTLACGEAVGSAGVAHWAELFGAVLERLEHATDVRPGVAASSDRTREVVLECAAALSQLRSTLVAEAEEARRYQSLQRSPAVARRASDIASTALERHSCPRSLRLGGSSRDDPGFLKESPGTCHCGRRVKRSITRAVSGRSRRLASARCRPWAQGSRQGPAHRCGAAGPFGTHRRHRQQHERQRLRDCRRGLA